MAVFVVNEWFWADLSGQNGRPRQIETFDALDAFSESSHQMVVIEGSAFDQKAWSLCRNDQSDIVQRIGGIYVEKIRQNSDRCRILKQEEISHVPEQLATSVKGDDHYLIEAQQSVDGSIIVTSDAPLREHLDGAGIPNLTREEFIRNYC